MDQEYVVDSSGRGTHPTLASAVQDAIKTGGDATISVEPTIYGVTGYSGTHRHIPLSYDEHQALCSLRLFSHISVGEQHYWPVCRNCEKIQRSLDERRKPKSAG